MKFVGLLTVPLARALGKSSGTGGGSGSEISGISPFFFNSLKVSLITLLNSSKDLGTMAPASFNALFLASAVSFSLLATDLAWPNWTSVAKSFEQVPILQATTGFFILPAFRASATTYSSPPPISPKSTIIFISGLASYLRQWSIKVEPG